MIWVYNAEQIYSWQTQQKEVGMAYIALSRFTKGSGNVEALVWFCDLISHGPNKPYHAMSLKKKLAGKVGLFPVYLETRKINNLICRSYRTAENRHWKEH